MKTYSMIWTIDFITGLYKFRISINSMHSFESTLHDVELNLKVNWNYRWNWFLWNSEKLFLNAFQWECDTFSIHISFAWKTLILLTTTIFGHPGAVLSFSTIWKKILKFITMLICCILYVLISINVIYTVKYTVKYALIMYINFLEIQFCYTLDLHLEFNWQPSERITSSLTTRPWLPQKKHPEEYFCLWSGVYAQLVSTT